MQALSKIECPLKKAEELEEEARQFGFYWERLDQLIEQIQSECQEIQGVSPTNRIHLQEEVGDLLHAAVSLVIFCGFDPCETLLNSIEKFKKRFHKLIELANAEGHPNLQNQSTEVLMSYWNRAKEK
jgi:uncharacterized protein YabN with tetrapyrrole methylase and pyrophosphatase domain